MPRDNVAKPPKGTTHVVLDTPAGLHGKRLKEVLKLAHKVVVPLQASVFDIFTTQDFLNELAESSRAAEQLRTFVEATDIDRQRMKVHVELGRDRCAMRSTALR